MLYIMRHGKTDWNEMYRLQGQTDIPLNSVGILQAQRAQAINSDIHFDICFCSPLIRARETARIFLENKNVPIITDDRLKEMNFGEYEGMSRIYEHPELSVYKFFKDTENYIADRGAENLSELYERTGNFLKEEIYPRLLSGKNVLIVGHGAMNTSIICQIRNTPLKDFWAEGIENCKLIKVIDSIYKIKTITKINTSKFMLNLISENSGKNLKISRSTAENFKLSVGDTVILKDDRILNVIRNNPS